LAPFQKVVGTFSKVVGTFSKVVGTFSKVVGTFSKSGWHLSTFAGQIVAPCRTSNAIA